MDQDFEYDVALSFAGEQRDYVERVAAHLREAGVRVFYDNYEKVNLWGKDLYEHLDYVYQRAAEYCVVFASAEYAEKTWTTHERRSAQARAIQEKAEYILPARFDDTEIPGIRGTVGYIGLKDVSPEDLGDLILEKLGPRRPKKFFPPEPIRLYQMLEVDGAEAEWTRHTALEFFRALLRMTSEERVLVFEIFAEGCDSQLPENVHISLDLLRRATGVPPAEALNTLRGLESLGFDVEPYTASEHTDDDMVAVTWDNRFVYDDSEQDDFNIERSTEVARAVLLGASEDHCRECAHQALTVLDLSALSVPLDAEEELVE